MTKEKVKQYFIRKNEIALLASRIEKDRSATIEHDVVTGSSPNFPFTSHQVHIEGIIDANLANIQRKERRLQKLIDELVELQKEMENILNEICDPEVRIIFELVVYDGKSFKAIAAEKQCDESTIRKKYNKAFEYSLISH